MTAPAIHEKRHPVPPRLLRAPAAAYYCSLALSSFLRKCPVKPVDLGDKVRRYDVRALDQWLDGLSPTNETKSDEQWLEAFGDDQKDGDDGER